MRRRHKVGRREAYDRLYALAARVLKRYNPCRSCITYCCHGCKHLGSKGCTVKALYCKIWLCYGVASQNPHAAQWMARLERIAGHYELLLVRGSRQESLKWGGQVSRRWGPSMPQGSPGASTRRVIPHTLT